jgi:hypothetical protein
MGMPIVSGFAQHPAVSDVSAKLFDICQGIRFVFLRSLPGDRPVLT